MEVVETDLSHSAMMSLGIQIGGCPLFLYFSTFLFIICICAYVRSSSCLMNACRSHSSFNNLTAPIIYVLIMNVINCDASDV